jgi:hypothetical protein
MDGNDCTNITNEFLSVEEPQLLADAAIINKDPQTQD